MSDWFDDNKPEDKKDSKGEKNWFTDNSPRASLSQRFSPEDMAAMSRVSDNDIVNGEELAKTIATQGTAALAGGALGSALEGVPALSSADRWKNMILGGMKGLGVADVTNRFGKFLSGEAQPNLTDPRAMFNDAAGATLGGLGGFFRAPQPPTKPTATALFADKQAQYETDQKVYQEALKKYNEWLERNNQLGEQSTKAKTEYDLVNKQRAQLKDRLADQKKVLDAEQTQAKTAESQAYHAAQARFRTALEQKHGELTDSGQKVINLQDEVDKLNKAQKFSQKNVAGFDMNTIDDELLKAQNKLDELRANKFEPDPGKISEIKENIKKYRTQVEQHSGAVKMQAQRNLQKFSRALEDEMGKASSADEANQEEVLNTMRRIRELRTAKGQVSGGRAHLPGQADDMGFTQPAPDETTTKIDDAMSRLDQAKEAYFKKKMEIHSLRQSQLSHAETAPGRITPTGVNMGEETRRLNELQDKYTQAREDAYELFRKQRLAKEDHDLHKFGEPSVPKEPKAPTPPSDVDKVGDLIKNFKNRGGLAGSGLALGLHYGLGLPWTEAGTVGGVIGGVGSRVASSPTGQAVLRQAPKAIPAVPVISEKAKEQLKELLGIK